ncbi:MAG: AI-2E family transporter [Methanomicrobiales archaeon]|nr:AI-2E family transporter [Methanomicrobiales archaeon]
MNRPSVDATRAAESPDLSTLARVLIVLAIAVGGMSLAAPFASPIIFAFVLAILAAPLVRWFEDRDAPAWLAPLLAIGIIVLVSLLLIALLSISLLQLQEALPAYQDLLSAQIAQAGIVLANLGIRIDLPPPGQVAGDSPFIPDTETILAGLTALVVDYLLIVIVTSFVIQEIAGVWRRRGGGPWSVAGNLAPFVVRSRNLVRYAAARTRSSLIAGTAIALLLWVLGIDTPILWAVVYVVLGYIPYFGLYLALAPPVGIGWLQYGLAGAATVLIGMVVIDRSVHYLFPYRVERELELSPLAIVLSIFFWTFVLGVPGLFLAIPLTLAVKAFLEISDATRWMAALMGPADAADGREESGARRE